METKHTQGPWTLGSNGDNCARDHAICSGPIVIAKVYGTGYPIGSGWAPTSAADARLIAAAPDMLAALESLFEHCAMVHNKWGDGCNQKEADAAIAAGRKAIAQARGAP